MSICSGNRFHILSRVGVLLAASLAGAVSGASWNGVLTDGAGKPVAAAIVTLHTAAENRNYTATTTADGKFAFADIAAGTYEVLVKADDKEWKATLWSKTRSR